MAYPGDVLGPITYPGEGGAGSGAEDYSVIIGGHEAKDYLLGTITLTRGRQGEGAVQPSILTFTVDNSDARFTPGGTGAWSADVVRGATVTAYASGVRRFTGTVATVALSWPHGVDLIASATITCADVSANWSEPIESLYHEWIKACHPLLWWPLTESNAPALEIAQGDYANRLVPRVIGEGAVDMLNWGGATGHPADEAASLLVDNLLTVSGAFLESVSALDYDPSIPNVVVTLVVNTRNADLPVLTLEDGGFVSQAVQGVSRFDIYRGTTEDAAGKIGYGWAPASPPSSTGVLMMPMRTPDVIGCKVRVGAGHKLTDWDTTVVTRDGSFAHLAILPAVAPFSTYPLPYRPPTTAAGPVSDKIEYLTGLVLGDPAEVVVSGAEPVVAHLPQSGASIADVLSRWSEGTGSRWVIDPSGRVSWVASNGGEQVTISAEWLSPSSAPVIDGQGVANTVDLTLPSGQVWTYTTGAQPIVRRAMVGAFGDTARSKALAQWVANMPDGVRLPTAEFDLLTIPLDQAMVVAALNIGDRLSITDLPTQMPDPTWTGVVEGATETWGPGAWSVAYSLTPDFRTAMWTLDHPTLSQLDAGNRLGF